MKKILFEDALILNTVKFLRALVRVLPLRVAFAAASFIGSAIYIFSKRRKIAYKNLRAAFSKEMERAEMKKIARSSMRNLAMCGVELLKFPEMNRRYIEENVRIIGTEKINEKLKEGRGAIFLTAHFGCWELLNLASNLVGYPMVALARTQKHPRSDEFLNSLRTSKGNQVIRKGMPVREILKALKSGKIVGMLSDQDGGKNGTFVKFFGRQSSSPSGVATFALRTHAPIFPVFIFREKLGKHRVEVGDPLIRPSDELPPEEAERNILQQFAKILESKIRKAPDQWLWAHRRWKSTPNRSIVILSDGKQGHLNQSLAVLNGVCRERESQSVPPEYTNSKIINVHFKNDFSKHLLNIMSILFFGHIPFKPWVMKNFLSQDCYAEIMKSYADIVISCGSSICAVNLLVKHENLAKSIVIMKPAVPSYHFDAVIVPRHDKIKGKNNIFFTQTTLSNITEEILSTESDKLLDRLSISRDRKRIGFLVGGDTLKVRFSQSYFTKLLQELKRFSVDTGAYLLATSSRRTPRWADELLKKTLNEKKQCPLLVIANESNQKGVVSGILGLSDLLVVSGESMSMVSEAIASHKPVVVFLPSQKGRLKPKHEDFLNRMFDQKLIAKATPENLYQIINEQMLSNNGRHAESLISQDREAVSNAVRRAI